MALVIGHSQTKYLSEYLNEDIYSVFSYPGFKTYQFQKEDAIFDVAPFFSVVVLVVGANDIGSRTPAEIVLLDEHLDFNKTARCVAQSASRALGLLIAKSKAMGSLPYNVYTKLYDTTVWPIVAYGAAVWGNKTYTCINAVQNRAMRFYLGLGKYTPIDALYGELAWQPPFVKQWRSVSQQWHRFVRMDNSRTNSRIFTACLSKSSPRCKNWQFVYHNYLEKLDLVHLSTQCANMSSKYFCGKIVDAAMSDYKTKWLNSINRDAGPSGRGRNKLRTYNLLKHSFEVEPYLSVVMPVRHRASLAKFRCGVAPIRLETGRYENLNLEDRVCPVCRTSIEDEKHVLLHCVAYDQLRQQMLTRMCELNPNFVNLTADEKLIFLLSDNNYVKLTAKTCYMILQLRFNILYK